MTTPGRKALCCWTLPSHYGPEQVSSRSGIEEDDWKQYTGRCQLRPPKEAMKKPLLVQPELFIFGQLFWASLTQRLLEWAQAPSSQPAAWLGDQGFEIAQVPEFCMGSDNIENRHGNSAWPPSNGRPPSSPYIFNRRRGHRSIAGKHKVSMVTEGAGSSGCIMPLKDQVQQPTGSSSPISKDQMRMTSNPWRNR